MENVTGLRVICGPGMYIITARLQEACEPAERECSSISQILFQCSAKKRVDDRFAGPFDGVSGLTRAAADCGTSRKLRPNASPVLPLDLKHTPAISR